MRKMKKVGEEAIEKDIHIMLQFGLPSLVFIGESKVKKEDEKRKTKMEADGKLRKEREMKMKSSHVSSKRFNIQLFSECLVTTVKALANVLH